MRVGRGHGKPVARGYGMRVGRRALIEGTCGDVRDGGTVYPPPSGMVMCLCDCTHLSPSASQQPPS
ncbi:hypothetical protein GCM10010321_75550 [Streptomyces chartreusis]|nr:hypothetical protein GCM10010321_75550 [Streptomyces chartreusis]